MLWKISNTIYYCSRNIYQGKFFIYFMVSSRFLPKVQKKLENKIPRIRQPVEQVTQTTGIQGKNLILLVKYLFQAFLNVFQNYDPTGFDADKFLLKALN